MYSLPPETILFPTATTREAHGAGRVLIDADGPTWAITDPRGERILAMFDGERTLNAIVLKWAGEAALEPAKAWLHVSNVAKDALRARLLERTRSARAPYYGRAAYLGAPRLTDLWLHTNNSCNLTCAHCLVESGPDASPGLESDVLFRIVDEALELGVERFFVTGGEPLVRSDVIELTDRMTATTALAMITNGTLLKGERLEQLKPFRDREFKLQVSLDGARPETNDPLRGAGSFERIVAGLRNAVAAGFETTLTTVVTRHNVDDLEALVALAADLGVPTVHLMWLHRRGRAEEAKFDVANYRLIEALRRLKPIADQRAVRIDNFDEMTARINQRSFVKNDLAGAGVNSLCVSYDGDVYPSAAFVGVPELKMGSVFKSALGAILSDSPVAHELRAATVDRKAVCHSCSYKFLCGGGDIEHSWFSSAGTAGTGGRGSVLGADPYCDVYKALISESFSGLYREKMASWNGRSGFDAPALLHSMGDESVHCATGEVHRDGELAVETLRSNCVLSFDLDRPRQVVREFYGEAMDRPQAELCCPVSYDPADTAHIPAGVIERFYGCGSPVASAGISAGETVLDIGSGGGIDVFIAARRVGPEGRAIGVDMTPQSLAVARANQAAVATGLGYDVCDFREGFMESLPVDDASVDLVTSNCVINLSPDKRAVLRELWRVLKDDGRMVVSDIVSATEVPTHLRVNEQLWGECLSGALSEEQFLTYLEEAGFYGVQILGKTYWKDVEGHPFFSLTVRGYKFEKKAGCTYTGQIAVYQGPMKAVVDEEGHFFPRGEAVVVCTDTAHKLKSGPYAASFLVVDDAVDPNAGAFAGDCGPACC